MEPSVLDCVCAVPSSFGLPGPRRRVDAQRRHGDLLRRGRVAVGLLHNRLPKIELAVPALRRAFLQQIRRSSLANGMAAQSIRSPLLALRPAQVGCASQSADYLAD